MLLLLTIASLAFATAMTVVAWRAIGQERRRADARVAALGAELARDVIGEHSPHRTLDSTVRAQVSRNESVASVPRPARLAAVIAATVFLAGSGAALAVVLSGFSTAARSGGITAQPAAPIELVALGHERDGQTLTVHGIVRNPSRGEALNGLTAVVYLFGSDGAFTSSARAAIDREDLAPGAQSRFTVVVPSAADVARYRVSFRTDQRVVTHVDRRGATAGSRR